MATELANYRVEYEDGSETFLQLDADGLKEWKAVADSKDSTVKSVTKADPSPINPK